MYSRQGSVPSRSGGRQLRRARHGQERDAAARSTRTAATTCRRPACHGCWSCSPKSCGRKNGIPVGGADEVMVTTGGIHGLYIICQALLEPGDEVIVPDPEWPPCVGSIMARAGRPRSVPAPRDRSAGASTSTSWRRRSRRRRARSTSTHRSNPTGGVLTREDVAAHRRDLCRERDLWLISDEAYEDVVFDEASMSAPASLAGHVRQDHFRSSPSARRMR